MAGGTEGCTDLAAGVVYCSPGMSYTQIMGMPINQQSNVVDC